MEYRRWFRTSRLPIPRTVCRQQLDRCGIGVDVIAQALEIAAARTVHDQRFMAPGAQLTKQLVTRLEAAGVSAPQPFPAGGQVGLRHRDNEVKMTRPEDIGGNLPAPLGASLALYLDKTLSIRVIPEVQLPPVPANHDVINRAMILDA